MEHLNAERDALLEKILDHMQVAVTCVDADGKVLYVNAVASKRATKTPREVGLNIRECHKDESNETVAHIFEDFRGGRREPHHYVSTMGGGKELVTIIPLFEGDAFSGCVSQIYPLSFEGPERSF